MTKPAPPSRPIRTERPRPPGGRSSGPARATSGSGPWWLRLASLYGPGDDPQKLLPAATRAAIEGRPFEMTAGEQVRDWLHVSDAVEAVLLAAERDPPGDPAPLNIGTGEEVVLRDLVLRVFAAAGRGPDLVRAGARRYRPGEVHRLVLDPSRAADVLPEWRPRTDLEPGVTDLVAGERGAGTFRFR